MPPFSTILQAQSPALLPGTPGNSPGRDSPLEGFCSWKERNRFCSEEERNLSPLEGFERGAGESPLDRHLGVEGGAGDPPSDRHLGVEGGAGDPSSDRHETRRAFGLGLPSAPSNCKRGLGLPSARHDLSHETAARGDCGQSPASTPLLQLEGAKSPLLLSAHPLARGLREPAAGGGADGAARLSRKLVHHHHQDALQTPVDAQEALENGAALLLLGQKALGASSSRGESASALPRGMSYRYVSLHYLPVYLAAPGARARR